MEDRKDDEGAVGWEGRFGWSRRVNLSRPLATLSRRAILRITSAASGQEMKIAPTLFNLDKSICYTTNGVAGRYILEEATLCLFSEGICAGRASGMGTLLFSHTCEPSECVLHDSLRLRVNLRSDIQYTLLHIFHYEYCNTCVIKGFIHVYKNL